MHTTRALVLRAVKYGETSLVVTLFTEQFGVMSFMVQGIRTAKKAGNRAGLLHPCSLIEIITQVQPNKNLQRIREFQLAYLYQSLTEDVVKNAIALFCVEVLLRLLPPDAPHPELFGFAFQCFTQLDVSNAKYAANLPVYFCVMCCRLLGYEITGTHSEETPYLNLREGGYSGFPPAEAPFISIEEGAYLHHILLASDIDAIEIPGLNGAARLKILHWLIEFLRVHTQHMGAVKSLAVLQSVFR